MPAACGLDDITTEDAPMARCLQLARVAARTDIPVLILGETGTGKTMLARAVHASSARADAPFVSFNAAALSETLLDSQLFGHEKGAFTGATRRVLGKFEQAHGGTLFIDEIADMTGAAQAKILRAVEYGEFERLGSESLQTADVRLISATHLPLRRFVGSNQFRSDLFYRISGLTITLPPLRERPRDLRALIGSEIAEAARRQRRTIIGLSREAAGLMFAYHWPGNLRELQRVVHAAVAITDGEVIQPDALLLDQGPERRRSGERLAVSPREGASASATGARQDLSLRQAERRHILDVLNRMDGCKRRTARALGVARTTLDRKLLEIGDGATTDTPSAIGPHT